ncbi:MAG: hypothetical protein ACO32D_07030, partial [Ilumatobacteraceae bacterium]
MDDADGSLPSAVVVGARVAVVAGVVDVDTVPPGGGFQPRIVVPAHGPESTLLSRPHSLWSIDKP